MTNEQLEDLKERLWVGADHKLTADEEKKVKLAAKELYNTLLAKKQELFVVGWQNDAQPKERVKSEIVTILNVFLPECYDREIFTQKAA